jgi:superfamily II DNA/RNA helicase
LDNRKDLIASALQHLKVDGLNEMQQKSLDIDDKGDVLLLSPTGTGKTIAYLLMILRSLSLQKEEVQTLIVSPTRELAVQISSVFVQMDTPWKCCCCYGGHPMATETRTLLEQHPALVIGTPGRIIDHFEKGNIQPYTIHTLVIDEFDKSLELGFQEEMEKIVGNLCHLTRKILASATDAEEIPLFVDMTKTVRLDYLSREAEVRSRLKLMRVLSPQKDKIETLYQLLCSLGSTSTIVFCNYRESVDRVGELLDKMHFPNERFHGGMEQRDRERSLYKFINHCTPVLVSTDLASRGLDIPRVEHIVHYHLPVDEEAFTHRNGRTARWDAEGTSYLILNEEEKVPDYIQEDVPLFELPEVTAKPPKPEWTTLYIGKGKKDKLSKGDIAGFMYKKGHVQGSDIGVIDVKEHCVYVAVRQEKVKSLLQLVQGEKVKGMKTIIEEAK